MLLSAIANHLDGRLHGDDIEIKGVSTLEEASGSDITFLANPRYRDKVGASRAGAIITSEVLDTGMSQVIVDYPYLAFTETLSLIYPARRHEPGIAAAAHICQSARVDAKACIYPNVYVGENATIAAGCVIHPGCFIGDGASIDSGTVLHPNVTVYNGCRIGSDCIIHAGAVIGSDGFGFVWDGEKHRKIPQVGIVMIGNHVEIGSNCTVDRAALTATMIGNGVKMDNLVQIGHNVVIGDHCILVAQSGVAGSSRLGVGVVLAGQAGVAGHISVGDGCTASAKAGIVSDLKPGQTVSGYPAMDHKKWLRAQKAYKDLPDMLKRIRELERRLDELEKD